jgi:uncharacterized protein (DUF3820 family)
MLEKYVKDATSRDQVDAPGKYLQWLHKRDPVKGIELPGRVDAGQLGD